MVTEIELDRILRQMRIPGILMMPGEVAALFGVDPKTVNRWAKSGKLKFVKTPGGHLRFRAEEIRDIYDGEAEIRDQDGAAG